MTDPMWPRAWVRLAAWAALAGTVLVIFMAYLLMLGW